MKNLIFTLLILSFCNSAQAEEVYPSVPPIRLNGMDQQNVGSCQAESETTALEFYFAELGLPLKLSTFYRHTTTWNNVTNPGWEGQEINDDDNVLRASMPGIAPHYMWPEDSQGVPGDELGDRPGPSYAANIDPSYPKGSGAFGYKETFYGFERIRPNLTSYRIPGSLEHLKQLIREKKALTLSMHSYLFSQFNNYTGLLNNSYSKEKIEHLLADYDQPNFEEAIDHSVAVVGFDDSLYKSHDYPAGPGAIIVRNSWNSPSKLRMLTKEPNEQEKALLEKMRLKVADQNLPGYYAIPYQYIFDLMNAPSSKYNLKGVGGYNWQQINAYQFYSTQASLSGRYEIYHVPYICDRRKLKRYAKEIRKELGRLKNSPTEREWFLRGILQDSLDRDTQLFSDKGSGEKFQIRWAKLSVNNETGVNRVLDFLDGQYDDYYCYGRLDKFPDTRDLESEDFVALLEEATREPSPGLVYELLKWIANNH